MLRHELDGDALAVYTYTVDAVGNRTGVTETLAPPRENVVAAALPELLYVEQPPEGAPRARGLAALSPSAYTLPAPAEPLTPTMVSVEAVPAAGHAPLTVSLVGRSTVGVVAWVWEFGDGQRGTEQNPTHIYVEPGVYTVRLTATAEDGTELPVCTTQITVTGAAPDPPAVDWAASPRRGPAPLTVSFANRTTGPAEGYRWEFGEGTTTELRDPTHTYGSPGVYAVRLTATGAGGEETVVREGYVVVEEPAAAAREAPPDDLELPEGTPEHWWQQVQEAIGKSEYHVSWQDDPPLEGLEGGAYQAPNRAQDLRAYLGGDGVRVVRRSQETPSWQLRMAVTGYGWEGETQPMPLEALSAEENRVAYQRGRMTEWYLNDERGIAQSFVLHTPPQAPDPGPGLLAIDLAFSGELAAHLSPVGREVQFTTAGGVRALRYGDLRAYDATGRRLPVELAGLWAGQAVYPGTVDVATLPEDERRAELWPELPQGEIAVSVAVDGVRLLVDATGAAYPLTVDPLLSTPGWAVESNQECGRIGWSVGTAGDVNGDGYDDVIVGAPHYDHGVPNEGRAYVYLGASSGLAETASWVFESDVGSALFGYSVSTAGDVNGDGYDDVIVGAPGYDNGETDEGCAYLFLGSSTGLTTTATWTVESDLASAQFGHAVSGAGDVNGDGFDDLIVGAPYYDGGQTDEGRVYVFLGASSGVTTTAPWTAEIDQVGALFGFSVDGAGDTDGDGYDDLIVGAPYYDGGQTDEGRVYVYLGSSSGVTTAAPWTAEIDQADARFGFSVAGAGDVNGDGFADLAAGAPYYAGGQTEEGRAYVYLGASSGVTTTGSWTAESDQARAWFGWAVSTAGDVNGDGYADLVVGARVYDAQEWNAGRAYVYHGSSTGLSETPDWTAEGIQELEFFGYAVGTAGDVDGDGCDEVIVGAYGWQNPDLHEGRAVLYYGSKDPTVTVITYTYDPLNRLTGAAYSTGESYLYAYDEVGNRTAMTITEGTVSYLYDDANRLTSAGGLSYNYDNAGNLRYDGTFTYTYNTAGRLIQAESVTHTLVYTYNGDGVRVAMAEDGQTIEYIVDQIGLAQVLVEITGTERITYAYGLARLWQARGESSTEWFLGDALGSVRQMVDGDGDVVLRRDYAPFGQVVAEAGTSSTGYAYTGEQVDPVTGLVFLRARWMSPSTGRFLSEDPFPGYETLPGTLHAYVYCLNSAPNCTDPSGEQPPPWFYDTLDFLGGAAYQFWVDQDIMPIPPLAVQRARARVESAGSPAFHYGRFTGRVVTTFQGVVEIAGGVAFIGGGGGGTIASGGLAAGVGVPAVAVGVVAVGHGTKLLVGNNLANPIFLSQCAAGSGDGRSRPWRPLKRKDLPSSYEPPRGGARRVRVQDGPYAGRTGWIDRHGNIWVASRPGESHGGPHWDVQIRGGRDGHMNVFPEN